MEMKDWRGNSYADEELGGSCETENCPNKAVRNCCKAEGDIGRTHWHGAIHTRDGGLKKLCRSCADKENAEWNKR